MVVRMYALSVDCADPRRVAGFWGELLGWVADREDDDGDVWLQAPDDADGRLPALLFLRDPNAKTVKNRLHLDLAPDDQAAEVERALGLGATRVDIGQTGEESWVVLADPEGNEFCILSAR